jgi:hypothetical protein
MCAGRTRRRPTTGSCTAQLLAGCGMQRSGRTQVLHRLSCAERPVAKCGKATAAGQTIALSATRGTAAGAGADLATAGTTQPNASAPRPSSWRHRSQMLNCVRWCHQSEGDTAAPTCGERETWVHSYPPYPLTPRTTVRCTRLANMDPVHLR